MNLNFHRVFWISIALFWGLESSLDASPKILTACRDWLKHSWSELQTKRLEPKIFERLKDRIFFLSLDHQSKRENPEKVWRRLNTAIAILKSSRWSEDQKKVLEFLLMDDTLKIGIDLSNRATMVSSRLDRPLLVISLQDLLDKETWVHEAAHWWITNEYPEITSLYQRVLKEAERKTESQVAFDLGNALKLWFEIKANEISISKSSASLETVKTYNELTRYWAKKIQISHPQSKSKAKFFRDRLREEILHLIRWGYGVKLDEHHLQLFDR